MLSKKLEKNKKREISWQNRALIVVTIVAVIVAVATVGFAWNHQSEVGVIVQNQTESPVSQEQDAQQQSVPVKSGDVEGNSQPSVSKENPVYPDKPVDASRGTKKDGISPSPVEDSTWYTQGP